MNWANSHTIISRHVSANVWRWTKGIKTFHVLSHRSYINKNILKHPYTSTRLDTSKNTQDWNQELWCKYMWMQVFFWEMKYDTVLKLSKEFDKNKHTVFFPHFYIFYFVKNKSSWAQKGLQKYVLNNSLLRARKC